MRRALFIIPCILIVSFMVITRESRSNVLLPSNNRTSLVAEPLAPTRIHSPPILLDSTVTPTSPTTAPVTPVPLAPVSPNTVTPILTTLLTTAVPPKRAIPTNAPPTRVPPLTSLPPTPAPPPTPEPVLVFHLNNFTDDFLSRPHKLTRYNEKVWPEFPPYILTKGKWVHVPQPVPAHTPTVPFLLNHDDCWWKKCYATIWSEDGHTDSRAEFATYTRLMSALAKGTIRILFIGHSHNHRLYLSLVKHLASKELKNRFNFTLASFSATSSIEHVTTRTASGEEIVVVKNVRYPDVWSNGTLKNYSPTHWTHIVHAVGVWDLIYRDTKPAVLSRRAVSTFQDMKADAPNARLILYLPHFVGLDDRVSAARRFSRGWMNLRCCTHPRQRAHRKALLFAVKNLHLRYNINVEVFDVWDMTTTYLSAMLVDVWGHHYGGSVEKNMVYRLLSIIISPPRASGWEFLLRSNDEHSELLADSVLFNNTECRCGYPGGHELRELSQVQRANITLHQVEHGIRDCTRALGFVEEAAVVLWDVPNITDDTECGVTVPDPEPFTPDVRGCKRDYNAFIGTYNESSGEPYAFLMGTYGAGAYIQLQQNFPEIEISTVFISFRALRTGVDDLPREAVHMPFLSSEYLTAPSTIIAHAMWFARRTRRFFPEAEIVLVPSAETQEALQLAYCGIAMANKEGMNVRVVITPFNASYSVCNTSVRTHLPIANKMITGMKGR